MVSAGFATSIAATALDSLGVLLEQFNVHFAAAGDCYLEIIPRPQLQQVYGNYCRKALFDSGNLTICFSQTCLQPA